MNKKVIVCDIDIVRKKGISYFQDNYFWPVSEHEYKDFVNFSTETYNSLLLDCKDNKVFDIMLQEYQFVDTIQKILHYNYVKNYSHEHEFTMLYGDQTKSLFFPDWEKFSSVFFKTTTRYTEFILFIKRILKNIIFNKFKFFLKKVLKPASELNVAICIGSMSDLKKTYIYDNEIYCDHKYWNHIINSKIKVDNELDLNKYSFVSSYLDALKSRNDLFVKGVDFRGIEKTWLKRLSEISSVYDHLLTIEKPKTLLVTDQANPAHKIITIAFQRSGVDVVCFSHGNNLAVLNQTIIHQFVISHLKKYVVPNETIKKNYEYIYSVLPIEKKTGTRYLSLNIPNINQYNNCQKKQRTFEKTKIMLIGFPANTNRLTDTAGDFSLFKIDLEYRIILKLKSLGYFVQYKAHPDRLDEISGIFNQLVDEYISERFENVINNTDLIVFTHAATTTFGYTLASNQPIVMINVKGNPWNELTYDALTKRVHMVPAILNNGIRIEFDQNYFAEKIKVAINSKYKYVANLGV